jgi:hypothetical protein
MDEVVNETPVTEEQKVEEVVTPQPGEKTDSALLLKSLQKEREEKRALEAQLKALQETPQSNEVFSDEGLLLKREIDALKQAQAQKDEQIALSGLQSQFPAIKDKAAEFENFRSENPGMRLETAAKAFLVENDLFEKPARKGLESQSGGGRVAPKEGMSAEDVKDLRNNNFRKYAQLLREGKIKVN